MIGPRRFRSAVASGTVVIAALVAAGCSGDDGTAPASTSSTVPPSTTTTVVFTGDPDSAFCGLLVDADGRPVPDPFEARLSPSDVEVRFRGLQNRFAEFSGVAPPELEDDIEDLVRALDDLGRALDAADFDFTALAEAEADVSAFDDGSFAQTAARIAAYRQQVCN